MFEPLIQLYRAAIAFLFMFVVALGTAAVLAEYLLHLLAVIASVIVLRLVWARTRW